MAVVDKNEYEAQRQKVKRLHSVQYAAKKEGEYKNNYKDQMRYMIKYNNRLRRAWDSFIIALAFATTLLHSINIAWKPFNSWYDFYDGFVFFIYLFDIVI